MESIKNANNNKTFQKIVSMNNSQKQYKDFSDKSSVKLSKLNIFLDEHFKNEKESDNENIKKISSFSRKKKQLVRVESWWVSSIVELIDKKVENSGFYNDKKSNIKSASSLSQDDEDFFGLNGKQTLLCSKFTLLILESDEKISNNKEITLLKSEK